MFRMFFCKATLILAVATLVLTSSARAYTPSSPVVVQMVERALAYLQNGRDSRVGGNCLAGLAIVKARQLKNHPTVVNAVAEARKLAEHVAQAGIKDHCYNETLACIFLCEVDPKLYHDEINTLLHAMLKSQRPSGAWSYRGHGQDDMSQTQYGLLCLWVAHKAGFDIPVESVERAANWLATSQDQSGGWSYMPPLGDATQTMTFAGTGSGYVCKLMFGFDKASGQKAKKKTVKLHPALKLPPALRRVKTESAEKVGGPLKPKTIKRELLDQVTTKGNAWISANAKATDSRWQSYYLYGIERYHSLKEMVEGTNVAQPKWYDAGVDYLRPKQQKAGNWSLSSGIGTYVDTAFCVLFLIRGTRIEPKEYSGRVGKPDELLNAPVKVKLTTNVQALTKLLTQIDEDAIDLNAFDVSVTLSSEFSERQQELLTLKRSINHKDYRVRLKMVEGLATNGELDVVPLLVFALSDPSPAVFKEARDGLRLISKKFQGFGLKYPPAYPKRPDAPEGSDELKQWQSDVDSLRGQWLVRVRAAQKKWKAWYFSVRPDGEWID